MKTDFDGLWQRIKESLRINGFLNILYRLYPVMVDHCFDLRYGVDTCARVQLSELTIESANKDRGYRYQPTRLAPLRKLFHTLKSGIQFSNVFVDIGCGKGRVLLAASEFNFKEVRGVEFARELCEIAKKNCDVYKAKRGLRTGYRVIECDAVNYKVKTDETDFFLFNPFDESILKQVLWNISASLQEKTRRIQIIYYNPIHAHVVEEMDEYSKRMDFSWLGYRFAIYSNMAAS